MSFKEKNIMLSLVNFSLIEIFFLVRLFQMNQNESFSNGKVFNLFGIVVFFAVVVTIIGIFIMQFAPTIIQAMRTGDENPEFDYMEDERDKLIDLKGTQVTYTLSSLGSFVAMLSFVFGQAPLTMFCLMIFFGLLAQILGDITRLSLYRRGI